MALFTTQFAYCLGENKNNDHFDDFTEWDVY